jgi:hypothetical protein
VRSSQIYCRKRYCLPKKVCAIAGLFRKTSWKIFFLYPPAFRNTIHLLKILFKPQRRLACKIRKDDEERDCLSFDGVSIPESKLGPKQLLNKKDTPHHALR